MIRLIATLLMLTTMAGGYMYYDFRMSARLAGRADADGLSFAEYLSGLTDRLAGLSDAASAGGMPTRLADMLPKAPEGWKLRAASAEDLRPFLPKSLAKADKAAVAALEALLSGVSGNGTEVAIRAYQKGDRTVLVQAVRYPNLIFTSSAALKERAALQAISAQFGAADVMTVRGLDVTEDLLPEDFRGRLFLADVGGQIHLRLLAPRRMKDTELLPFFETLNVEAMNASVIDKVEGLGKVPLIVLASALDDTDREAYVAARARRAADKAQRQEEARSATEVQTAAPPSRGSLGIGTLIGGLFGLSNATGATAPAQAAPVRVDCATGKNGVKRCMVSEDAGG